MCSSQRQVDTLTHTLICCASIMVISVTTSLPVDFITEYLHTASKVCVSACVCQAQAGWITGGTRLAVEIKHKPHTVYTKEIFWMTNCHLLNDITVCPVGRVCVCCCVRVKEHSRNPRSLPSSKGFSFSPDSIHSLSHTHSL